MRIVRMTVIGLVVICFGCKTESTEANEAAPEQPTPTAAAPAQMTVENAAAYDAAMEPVLQQYLALQETLAADELGGVPGATQAIITALKKVDGAGVTGSGAEVYKALPEAATKAATELSGAKEIAVARQHFKALSLLLSAWAKIKRPEGIDMVWCAMTPGGWLQRKGLIRNPYYGASMLECGEKMN